MRLLQTLGAVLRGLFPRRRVRLTLEVEEETAEYFQAMAKEKGVNLAELLRRGLSTMKEFKEQKKIGRNHMGFVADRTKLDAEMLLSS